MISPSRQTVIGRSVTPIAILLLLTGFGFVAASFVDPAAIQSHAASLSSALVATMLGRLRALGIVYCLLAGAILYGQKGLQLACERIADETSRLQMPLGRPGWVTLAIAVLTIAGAALRWSEIHRVVRYDEAFTYEFYARRALYAALADYSLPNNHLAHTLLVWLSTRLFGLSPLSLRLPAFLSSVALLPAVYAVGKKLYGTAAGIAACALAATSPALIEFSINARGYSLVCLSTLLMLWAAQTLRQEPDRYLLWAMYAFAAIVAVYTIPLGIIPVLGIALWGIVEFRGSLRARAVKGHVAALAVVVGVLIVLYTPPVLHDGVRALVANRFVAPQESFVRSALQMPLRIWIRWTDGLGWPIVWLLPVLLIASLLAHRRFAKHRIPPFLFLAVWSSLCAIAGRIVGYPRVWLFLLPIFLISCGAGLAWIVGVLGRVVKLKETEAAGIGLVSAVVALVLGLAGRDASVFYWSNETGALQDGSEVAEFVYAQLQPEDALVMSIPAMPTVVFEVERRHGMNLLRRTLLDDPRRIVLVLPKSHNRTEYDDTHQLKALLANEKDADLSIIHEPQFLSELGYDERGMARDRWGVPQLMKSFQSASVYAIPIAVQ
jgi:hypothetical protein